MKSVEITGNYFSERFNYMRAVFMPCANDQNHQSFDYSCADQKTVDDFFSIKGNNF
jgi:hypothetical protein